MNSTLRTWKQFVVFSVAAFLVTGCIGQPLEGEEKERWISIASPIAENILKSINNNDYQGFTADFSQEMMNSFPPQEFANLREMLESKIGKYISKTPAKVTEEGEYIVVYFDAQYEKEEAVTVKVVFEKGDETYKVQGLWFDSPKLRE